MRVAAKVRSVIEKMTAPSVVRAVREKGLTYLSLAKFQSIQQCLDDIAATPALQSGHFAEFGIALGGSAIVLCKNLPRDARFFGFDVFGMIPPPSELDDSRAHERYAVIKDRKSQGINGAQYYGYETDLYGKVVQSFESFGVKVDNARVNLIQGLFEDTVPNHLPSPVSFAHVDCDWYKPVMFCLEQLAVRMLPGGYIVLDDYNDYGGCKKATDEFLGTNASFSLISTKTNAVLRKKA